MPDGLFDFQEHGAHWIAQRERAGLHDVMGIGKTAQMVKGMNLRRVRRAAVIGPAGLRTNFVKEWRKWSEYDLKLCMGRTIHDYIAWQKGRYDVLITSFEQAVNWYPAFRDHGEIIDAVMIDEAHGLKNHKTLRSQAILGHEADGLDCWMNYAEWGVWSTGTPMPNDPSDIYTFLRFANAMPLEYSKFIKRYFETRSTVHGFRCAVRPDMAPELRALIDNNAIRRTKAEVGIQIPPIFLTSMYMDGDTQAVVDLLKDHPGLDKAIEKALKEGGLSFLGSQYVSTLRRLIGEAKVVPYAHQLLDELRGDEEKRVIFGIHKDVLAYLHAFLTKNLNSSYGVVINGDVVGDKKREAAVEQFQNDPHCRWFIGNMKAAGVGLTLHAAYNLDVLESDWTPAGNAQAIMRVHRIGQTHTVHGRFITLANTFDETVNRIVADKTAAIAEIEGEAMNAVPTELTAF